jgi:hypothetical protein
MINEVKYFADIRNESNDAAQIIANAMDITMVALSRDFGYTGMTNKFSMDGAEYDKKNAEVKKAVLAFCGGNSGVKEITEKKHLVNAFDNPTFVSIYNAIIAESLLGVMTKTAPSQIMALANIHEVDVGDSLTFEIETKGIPVAQRNSYMNNVVLMEGYSISPITVTPKVYSIGTSIDYIRILGNNFDFGKEIARVAMGLIYAQFKLVVGILFNTANVTGTPLYNASFAANTYTLLISYLQALNNAPAKAYGTIPAFQSMGATATTNYGFTTQDEVIRQGYLGRAYGIDNIAIDQATDLSAPFTTDNLASLLLVPNNRVLLISDVGDKPVKLVRENFIRVISKEPKAGSLYRQDYTYTMSFEAALATQAHYGIQGV